ncbi:PadR family transcriptional regulator [Lentibacillus halophilus]|uniref:PadR family transcriptional regulator n=1 Tax=Lentibacillus halophilus TaxID=295065 RepID=A0ABP3J541_9BACI
MNPQFKKGVLTLCVLNLLQTVDQYGYDLIKQIGSNLPISEGTLYPILRRLKKDGYLTTYLVESEQGPSRKYYKLTKKGDQYARDLKNEWELLVQSVEKIVGKGEERQND